VLTPPPEHASELTVHVCGKLHEPSGSSHEHALHVRAGGAGVPSNARIGASAGHAGGSLAHVETNATAFHPSGAGGTHDPPAQSIDVLPSPASSAPASKHCGGNGGAPLHTFGQSHGIGIGPSGQYSGKGQGQHRSETVGPQSSPMLPPSMQAGTETPASTAPMMSRKPKRMACCTGSSVPNAPWNYKGWDKRVCARCAEKYAGQTMEGKKNLASIQKNCYASGRD